MTVAQTAATRRTTRRQRRMLTIAIIGVVLTAALGLVLIGLSDRIVFFNSPSDIVADRPPPGQRIRLGGLVATGSFVSVGEGVYEFEVTDGAETIAVTFRGLLPDLFGEGQGVITEGTLASDGLFQADTVLAKHDEAYMPAEVTKALREQGVWQGDEANAPAP